MPIALIEAKDSRHGVGAGMQQALSYAETLNIPYVFSSNGRGFVLHDRTGASTPREGTLALDAFPLPSELKRRSRSTIDSTGVGFSIVKKTVEGVGGAVSIDSVPVRGTTFAFTWPREVEAGVALRQAA